MNVLDNLNAWRAVSAAARTGSVTAAAEQLGISHEDFAKAKA